MLLGDGPQERLFHASVALFGVGGVGGFCAEALARAGIGALDLYDDDTVSESNLNRQIAALHSTLGRPKGEVLAERVRTDRDLTDHLDDFAAVLAAFQP